MIRLYMTWIVDFYPDFLTEAEEFSREVKMALQVEIEILEAIGPQLGRPQVDTLKASKFGNMKELRFTADEGVWRVAFAFDPERTAIVLVGGDKKGKNQKKFYEKLMKTADKRYQQHLDGLKAKEKKR